MAFIVEIFRKVNGKNTGIDLNIHASVWEALISNAKEEGWVPLGTIKPANNEDVDFVNDYMPDYPDAKVVGAEDATHWAKALLKVRTKMVKNPEGYKITGPVIIREEDSEASPGFFIPNLSLHAFDRFIAYISRGEFYFWWED